MKKQFKTYEAELAALSIALRKFEKAVVKLKNSGFEKGEDWLKYKQLKRKLRRKIKEALRGKWFLSDSKVSTTVTISSVN